MPSLPLLKALGLNFSPNQLEVQPGSLVEASNIIIRRDDVIESRRGYALYGTAMGSSSDRCKQLFTYRNRIIRHFSNRLQYENGLNNSGVVAFYDFNENVNGTPVQATIEDAQNDLRIKSIQANSNLYFTSSEGIRKISARSTDTLGAAQITQAGGIKALDVDASLVTKIGNQSSFLSADSGVAYKVVWGTKDANNNLILGTPSEAATILNPLLDLVLRDFSNFLLQLDNVTNTSPSGSLLNDINYYSLALPLSAEAPALRKNLIDLAEKLDKDLLFATNGGAGTAYQPLNLSSATASSGIVTVNFTVPMGGVPVTGYFKVGDKIVIPVDKDTSIYGFTSGTGSPPEGIVGLNTNQVVTAVTPTSIQFIPKEYSVSNPVGVSGAITEVSAVPVQGTGDCTIRCNSHGLKTGQKVIITGTNSVPSVDNNTGETYTVVRQSDDTFKINLQRPYATTQLNAVAVTFQDTNDTVTYNSHGLLAGDIVVFSSIVSTTGISINTPYYVINPSTNTFQLALTAGGSSIVLTTNGTGTMQSAISQTIVSANHGYIAGQTVSFLPSTSVTSEVVTFIDTLNGATVTFQDTGDTVTFNSHGLSNGTPIVFSSITSTTGIFTNTVYYVVNAGTNTFQLAASVGGSALSLTTNGSGVVANDIVISSTPNLPHGLSNGDRVQFTSLTTTVGISTNTQYYVVNATTNTFQLAETAGGAVLPLTFTGTGVMNRVFSTNTYYVLSAGLTTNSFKISTTISGAPNVVSGSGTVAKVVTEIGTAGTWNVYIDGLSTVKIESNELRSIEEPVEQTAPATNDGLVSLETYLDAIISKLQTIISARESAIVSASLYSTYLKNITPTTTASVSLSIAIPPAVLAYTAAENPYFYQVYRTGIYSATGVTNINEIGIIQEYNQIDEKFPSSAEISAKTITYLDTIPESIGAFGASLYTNERSGEGALQANDVPPFALDINTFKGYTFFSNTRTRQRKTLDLIGVETMVTNYNPSNTYKLTIADNQTSNTYSFVLGVQEVSTLTCASAAGLSTITGNYFLLNSANNKTQYHVWYKVGAAVDPAITTNGIAVSVNASDSAAVVAEKTKNALNNNMVDFSATAALSGAAVTFQDVGDTVTYAAHGLSNGTPIIFSSITSTTGILINTIYYVVNASTNTFQLASSVGGAVLPLTTNGSGIVSTIVIITNLEAGSATNIAIGTLPVGFSVATTQQGQGENATLNQVLLSSNVSTAIAIEETAKSLIRVINKNSNEIVNAFYLSGAGTTPGSFLLEGKSLTSNEFSILTSNSFIGESFNPDLSPNLVVINSIGVGTSSLITTSSNHNLLNGDKIIITNSDSTPSIDGIYEIDYETPTQFYVTPVSPVTVSGNRGAFESVVSSENSTNDEQQNRVYYSKYQQPEAVPILNYLDIGATGRAILRIFPLRDSLFVFKEDGLYRISGEIAPFTVSLFDSSCILIAPDSVAVSNNQLFGWTTQGVSTIVESGVSIISRPIDTEILKKASSQFANFKTATWGVGYESDNSYTVYTTDKTSDSLATIGFRFSTLTNSWTTVGKSSTCGIVNSADDKLYLGAGDTNYIEKERKEFTRYDYADRELSFNIALNSLSQNTITLPTVSELAVGDVVVQNQTLTVYEFNALLQKLDIDPGVPSSNYYATLAAQAGDNLRIKIEDLATKLDSDVTPGYSTKIGSFVGSIASASIANPTLITTTTNHNLQTGRKVSISGNSVTEVNGNFMVTVISNNSFTIPVDLLSAGSGGTFSTMDNDFADIKTCYNLIISTLNSDPIVAYSNYRSIDNDTTQEAIIQSINNATKIITLNLSLDYVVGPIIIYKAIPCSFTYSPLTFGDSLGLKHMREATMMFANKAFTSAELNFSTDLLPEEILVPFNGDGNGIFGHQSFGSGFFGGVSNAAPFRTYIPRQCQRCRYLNVGFSHKTAREEFAIYGLTLTGEVGQSTRAYR